MKKEKKFQSIKDNYINGNKKAYRDALVKLSKQDLLALVAYWNMAEDKIYEYSATIAQFQASLDIAKGERRAQR